MVRRYADKVQGVGAKNTACETERESPRMTTTTTKKSAKKSTKTARQLLRAQPRLTIPTHDPAAPSRQQAVYDVLDYVMSTLGTTTAPWYGSLTGAQRRLVRAAFAAFGQATIAQAQRSDS